ncbi:hypothetical protein FBEOM_3775 [Fusarium beomiforme]|uniref:Uncharacterized protein n=1 Tax=Fusarium beomiforme TaxID=44412 RepID=A0A9P5APH1_9HYPO|nr:hypothetical protein FBEOM_3775 [Fusarium beomiforme]
MAEQSWLRFLGGNRARQHDLKHRRSEAALQDLLKDAPKNKEALGHRQKKSLTRLPSWQGTSQATKAATSTFEAEYSLDEVDKLFINAGQQVWHNPSIDQVAETLRVALMTNPANEALSAEYRSHILLLCEAYGTRHSKIAKLENELAEAKGALKEEMDRHNSVEEHWMVQDARYKAEVKRLEVFIHRMSDKGMEAVALARAGSLIRGRAGAATRGPTASGSDVVDTNTSNGFPETILESEGNSTLPKRRDTVLSRTRTMDSSNEVRLSRGFRVQDHLKKKKRATHGARRLEAHAGNDGETRQEQGRAEQHDRSASELSIGQDKSDTTEVLPHEGSVGRGRDSTERPTAMEEVGIVGRVNSTSTTLTHNHSSQDTATELKFDRRSHQNNSHHRRQFSFVPGDDKTAVRQGEVKASGNTLDNQGQNIQAPSTGRGTGRFYEENRWTAWGVEKITRCEVPQEERQQLDCDDGCDASDRPGVEGVSDDRRGFASVEVQDSTEEA